MCAPAGIPLFPTLLHVLEDVGKEQRPWNQAGIGPCLATYWPEDRAAVELCQLSVKWAFSTPVLGLGMSLFCGRSFFNVTSQHLP